MPDWPDAVLFDFDGVLVHSEPLHYIAFKTIADREGLSLTEERYYNELLGYDDYGAFRRLAELNGKPIDRGTLLRLTSDKAIAAEALIHQKRFDPLPGVEEVVRGLWRNYPLAICSGALSNEIELILDGVRLRDCFRVIVSAEDVTVGKPDPESYLRGIEMLSRRYHRRMNPKNCMVIEDAPRVLDRLKPLGFICVAVATHVAPERFTSADYILNSLDPAEVKAKIPQLQLYEG